MRKRKDRQRKKRDDATVRQAAWDTLTPAQKLKALDTRPGASKRERAKIKAAQAVVANAKQ